MWSHHPARRSVTTVADDALELPDDLTGLEYRRRARALVQQSADEPHGPRADRLVAQARVFALCALSAPAASALCTRVCAPGREALDCPVHGETATN